MRSFSCSLGLGRIVLTVDYDFIRQSFQVETNVLKAIRDCMPVCSSYEDLMLDVNMYS